MNINDIFENEKSLDIIKGAVMENDAKMRDLLRQSLQYITFAYAHKILGAEELGKEIESIINSEQ